MTDFFEGTEGGEHGQHGLDHPPVIPLASPADFKGVRSAGSGRKAGITQHQHPIANGVREHLERDIGGVSGGPHPANDQTPAIQQYSQLDADDPAMVRQALAAHRVWTAPFPDRGEQFNPIGIDNPEQKKDEIAAYDRVRREVMRMIGGVRGTVSANTIRQALDKASKEIKSLGEYSVDAVNKAAEAVRREITSKRKH